MAHAGVGSTHASKAANAKVQPILDELKKLGTFTSDVYTDWLVF